MCVCVCVFVCVCMCVSVCVCVCVFLGIGVYFFVRVHGEGVIIITMIDGTAQSRELLCSIGSIHCADAFKSKVSPLTQFSIFIA